MRLISSKEEKISLICAHLLNSKVLFCFCFSFANHKGTKQILNSEEKREENASKMRKYSIKLRFSILLIIISVLASVGQIETSNNNQKRQQQQQQSRQKQQNGIENLKTEQSFAEIFAKTNWKFQYISEQSAAFKLLINDSLLDERLANVVATVKASATIDLDSFKFNTGSPEEDARLLKQVAGSAVNEELCGEQLIKMLDQMDELESLVERRRKGDSTASFERKHLYLTQALDSFGRYESGHLMGRIVVPGSYPQCQSARLMLNESNPNDLTPTRLCLARLKLDKYLESSLDQYRDDIYLGAGICIPRACHTLHSTKFKHLFQRLANSQFKLPKSLYVQETLPLDSIFCLPDEDGEFGIPRSGKILITLLIGWLGLVVYSTVKSEENLEKRQRTRLDTIFDALSLKTSWSSFICQDGDKNKGPRIELNTLNPVKVLCCAFVVFGHAFLTASGLTMDLLRGYRSIEENPSMYFVVGGTVVTDTFYVCTGLILTYIAMKKMAPGGKLKSQSAPTIESNGNVNGRVGAQETTPAPSETSRGKGGIVDFVIKSLGFTINRYMRLMPLFYLAFWFKKSVLINMTGMGPLWDNGFNKETESGACRQESWWSPLQFGPAYLPLSKQCIPHTWSVAGDLFFAILLGPFVVGSLKRPKLALGAALIFSIISNFAMYKALVDIPAPVVFKMRDFSIIGVAEGFRHYSSMYTWPHLRTFSVLIGAMAGCILYYYEQGDKIKEWPEWFKGRATKFSFAIVIITLSSTTLAAFLRFNLFDWYPIHLKLQILDHSLTTGRFIWDIANAIIFLRMITDWKDNYLMRNFSAKFWRILVKLNYGVLLVHMDLLIGIAQLQSPPDAFDRTRYHTLFASSYMMSLMLALPIFILIELPIDRLGKVLLMTDKQTKVNSKLSESSTKTIGHKKLNEFVDGLSTKSYNQKARLSNHSDSNGVIDGDMCTKI